MRSSQDRITGFTRREALFLLAFVAAALAVAWPYFRGKQIEKERVASFQNLQQWGIALNLYLVDNDNHLPGVGSAPISAEPADAWYNALPSYISRPPLSEVPPGQRPRPGEDSIWIDPSAKAPRDLSAEDCFFTYGMNRFLQPVPRFPSYKTFDLSDPSATIFLTETSGTQPGILPGDVAFRHRKPQAGSVDLAFILFCDGHVSSGSSYELVDNPEATEPRKTLAPVSWAPFVGAPKPERMKEEEAR